MLGTDSFIGSSEKPFKVPVRYYVFWVVVLGLLPFWLLRVPRDTVTFRVVDGASGRVLTNATAQKYGRWTALPIEKARVSWLDPWKTTVLKGVEGKFEVADRAA